MNAPVAPESDSSFDHPALDPGRPYPPTEQTPPQQPYAPQASAYQPYPLQRVAEDPGKVLGVISLVAALSTFIGFNFIGPIVGIITGHLARKKSREAGFADNDFGKWGFILSLVFIGIAIVGAFLGISISAIVAMMGEL